MTTTDLIDLLPVRVPLGRADMEGALVFRNGHVVAMLVRVGGARCSMEPGRWKVQATFGLQSFHQPPPLFDSIGLAANWFRDPANENSTDGLYARILSADGAGHITWNPPQSAG